MQKNGYSPTKDELDAMSHDELWDAFLQAWPYERLQNLTLTEYQHRDNDDSFAEWLETKTKALNGDSFVFGEKFSIYNSDPSKTNKVKDGYCSNEFYCWKKELGTTPEEAFEKVKSSILRIVDAARHGDVQAVQNDDVLDFVKWKIAFLYQDRINPAFPSIFTKGLLRRAAFLDKNDFSYYKAIKRIMATYDNSEHIIDFSKRLSEKALEIRSQSKTENSNANETKSKSNNTSEGIGINKEQNEKRQSYTDKEFLHDVWISKNDLRRLKTLLLRKKNIILQGPPGVGKTWTARRLARLMDDHHSENHICMVQFHQNYAYEDFIHGYKPTANGFTLTDGVFLDFCKKAEQDRDHKYFFIIDEINRGNLSKILGEVMMLIETDHRNDQIRLPNRDDLFCVPDNIYVIGMMNTADRSLAIIDYALRRRFSFFTMTPGFESIRFKEIRQTIESNLAKGQSNPKYFEEFLVALRDINKAIANHSSLGKGFLVGHSYLAYAEKLAEMHESDPSEWVTKFNEWLSDVVEFDLIPLFEEYLFDDDETLENWLRMLRPYIINRDLL